MSMRGFRALLVVGVAALSAGTAAGEREHEFGMALLKKFRFDDLAEKYFNRLKSESDRDLRLSGILGLAEIRKTEAVAASRRNDNAGAEKAYAEALELYESFLKQAQNHPEMSTALSGVSEIKKKRATALKKAADAETDEDKKRELLREALKVFESLTGPLGEEAEKAKARFIKERDQRSDKQNRSPTESKYLETAVLSMQRNYMMLVDQAEIYPKDSDTRKKFVEKMIKGLSAELEHYEAMDDMHGVVLWLFYTLGRGYSLNGKYKEACEKGYNEVLQENATGYPSAAREFVDNLRMFSYYMKAQAAMDAKKYEDAISTIDTMFMPPPTGYPQALDDARGNASLIIKARALAMKEDPDYARAVQECQRVIRANNEPWPNNARQLLAEINRLTTEESDLPPDPATMHESALGMFQLALQDTDRAKSKKTLEEAIVLYERTLTACQENDVPLKTRLQHEPSAWFEMGICYSRLQLWYEAGFAFEAGLRYFAKDVVGLRLADMEEFRELWAQVQKDVKSGKIKPTEEGEVVSEPAALFDEVAKRPQFKALLGAVSEKLKKSANNLMVSARRRKTESQWDFDSERYQAAILTLIQVDPAKRPLLDFHRAAAMNTDADSFYRAGKKVDATKSWIGAADLFMTAAKTQPSIRGTGYHMAAKSYYRSMNEAKQLAERAPSLAQQVPDLGKKALKAFEEFERHSKQTPPKFGEAEKRQKRLNEGALAKPVIFYGLGDLANTIKSSDEYLALESRDEKYIPTVMWTRFKALCDMATESVGTDGEAEAISTIEEAAKAFGTSPDFKRFYGPACSMVSATFTKALKRATELAKGAGGDEKAGLAEKAVTYRRASAEWMKKLIELDPERAKNLGFMASIAKVFYDQKAFTSARELYQKVLETHDKSGSGQMVALAEGMFESAAKKVVFDKESTTDEVRKKIRSLQVKIFGEPEEERKGKPPKKRDWQGAHRICQQLLAKHPKIQCADALTKARDELSFRLQILTVRLNLSDCTRALARQVGDSNREEAKQLWEEAIVMLEKVREYWWRDNELRFLLAECYAALDKYDDALKLFALAGRSAAEYSPMQYRANVQFSRLAFKKGDYREAMRFPYMLTSGVYSAEQEWKEYFPDAGEFVAKCEDGIKKAGGLVALRKIDIGEYVDYDKLMSDTDESINSELMAIKRRIEEGLASEDNKADLQRNVFEVHFRLMIANAIEAPVAAADAKRIKKSEIKVKQKQFLARLLYQSPFKYGAFRDLGVRLGFFEKTDDTIPMSFFSEKVKKKAIELELLNEAGEKRPISEISSDLLLRGLGAGVDSEQPAESAESAESKEDAPESEEQAEPEVDDGAEAPVPEETDTPVEADEGVVK